MAFSGSQITRLSLSATPTQKNGSFAGKTEDQGRIPFKGFLVNVNRMGIRRQ